MMKEKLTMIQETIEGLEETIRSEYGNIAGIVVLKNGEKRYEQYFNSCNSDSPIHVCSVTKSIISILIGIAADLGYIGSVEQRVLDFYPDYRIKRGEKTIETITVKHLLTMTAPFKFRSAPYTKFFSSADWVKSALDLLGGKKPASGWVADESGTNTAGWGLTLTAMDMAKVGRLYLDGGRWQGRQIVSAGWVSESTAEHSRWREEDLPYGYLWWTGIGSGYAAMGNSGNVIYVNPAKQEVISIAALFKPTARDIIGLIQHDIEPLFEG